MDVSLWGALSGGIELTGDYGAQTLMAASGNTIKVSADQTGAITLDTNDGATSSALTLDIDNDTVGITTADVDSLTIDTGTGLPRSVAPLTLRTTTRRSRLHKRRNYSGATSGGDITVSALDANFAAIDATAICP